MIGSFQDPMFLEGGRGRPRAQLQILKEAFLPGVNGSEVSRTKERLVGWNAASGNEFLRKESVTVDCDAFMRRGCAHWINRIRPPGETAKPPQAAGCHPNARIGPAFIGSLSGNREHDFPDTGRAVGWVLREQLVQKSRTAARHAGYKDRP